LLDYDEEAVNVVVVFISTAIGINWLHLFI